MPTADLSRTSSVDTSGDSVVIQKLLETIPGGRTLDVTGVTEEVLKAGRVIIEETATGNLKPLAISSGSYASLPASHTYKGILYATVLTAKPLASIMVRGTVNEEAAKNVHELPSVPAGAKEALSLIRFVKN